MFINTGGLPEQHKTHSKLHLHLQRHHHGYKHPQQFGQHYQPCWSRRLTARRHSLLPDPRCHGSLSPAELLLKPWTPHPTLLCLNTPPHPSSSHPVQPYSPALHHLTWITWMDSTGFFVLLK